MTRASLAGRARGWVCSNAFALVALATVGVALRVNNLEARDPFIDEVNWVNAAVEHFYNAADYTDPAYLVAAYRAS